MSDYVPTDLLIEILQKLPVKYLIRFAAVSKSWRSIITSAAFIASHLSKGKNHTLIHTLSTNSLVKFTGGVPFAVNSPSKLKFPYYESRSIYLRIVDSCDGLVCLSNNFFKISFAQPPGVIWNPYVRNHVVLPDPTINPKDAYISVLGFGVDAGRSHHKVVRLVYCRDAAGIFMTQVEIFSLKTWSWRRLIGGVDLTLHAYPSLYFRQVFLNGVVHWLIEQKPIGDNSFRRSYILAFDVGDEVFGEVMLPEWEAGGLGFAKLSIFVIRESLGVVKLTGESCDVWVMKEYRVKESWTKLYTVCLFEKIENVVGFVNSGEALLALENSRLVVYNSETKQTKDLGIYRKFFIHNYVESLLFFEKPRCSRYKDTVRDGRHTKS
ncbi:hypothetical protein MIMGU_mgv1a018271mg [Erythranthe guttata]|uniref:F-box domain-containing protein n=1 Tax=Erythranthe guttata TaxID=4155 RepID=A0A022QCB9_ERYGU|nr:hypothetical protein MIMGU_mgv1a018271mg [Erythranthe guttata]